MRLPHSNVESAWNASLSERERNEHRTDREDTGAMVHERRDLRAAGTPSEGIAWKRRSHPRQIVSARAGCKRGSGPVECLLGSANWGWEAGRFARMTVRARRLASSLEWSRTCLDSVCSFMQV